MRACRYLPNVITLVRLTLVPANIWLILRGDMAAAFWVFVAAGVSDAIDGGLARLLRAQSALGSYLDALADKVLLVSVYLALGYLGHLWTWLVVLVVGRDLWLVGSAAFMYVRGTVRKVVPLPVSKVNTAAQITLAAVVLGHDGLGLFPAGLVTPLSWLVAATTAVSALAYMLSWQRRRRGRQLS